LAISDLAVIDRLTTRARRDGSNLYIEVLDGPEVLKSTQYTNGSSITPSEIPALLQDALLSVISGDRGTGGGSFVTVTGTVAVGNTLTATLGPNVTATSFQWKRNGVNIAGAVNSTYIVQDIDAGKDITVSAIGISVGASGGTPPAITDPRPGFAQASPLGAASGGRRNLSTQHNSYSMYLAQCDGTGAEVALTNTSIFASAGAAEAASSSPLTYKGWAYFPTATWANRTVDVSATGGVIPAGATSCVFTGTAAIETALYLIRFSTGELRWATLTAGQNTLSWRAAAPLQQAATASIQWKQRGSTGWTRVPLTFNGSDTITFEAGVKKVVKCEVTGTVRKGVPFMVSLNVTPTNGVYPFELPAQQNPNGEDYNYLGLQEAFNDTGSDVSGTFWGGAPWAVAGFGNGSVRPLSVKVLNPTNAVARPVTILGDSIPSSLASWTQRWFSWKGIPYVLLSKAGETPGGAIAQSEVRSQVYDKGLVVCQLGRNSYSLAQLQNLWAYCRAQGFSKIIQVLPPPQTTSPTNNWTTADSQDADTNTRAVNAQVIAAVGTPTGPHGIIDTFTPCVTTKTGGGDVWVPEFTIDGTHPAGGSGAAILAHLDAQNTFALFDING
jgi:hypothetical protein